MRYTDGEERLGRGKTRYSGEQVSIRRASKARSGKQNKMPAWLPIKQRVTSWMT